VTKSHLEIALNFKDHGNELYLQKSYKEAVKSYTEGLDAGPVDFDLRISLLNNRAASHLFLKNYASVLKDAGVVIALCTKEKKPVPIKALFRAGKALVALERWKEAKDVVDRGKQLASEKDKKDWELMDKDIESGWRRVVERAERIRREKQGKFALQAAIEVRR
jgi:tetratricopeptide (TPR) repeat protein